MKKETLALLLLALVSTATVWAGDTHQIGQGHKIIYTITTISGDPVKNITCRTSVSRSSDGKFFDWSTGAFSAAPTTRLKTMSYNPTGEFYEAFMTMDSAIMTTLASEDVVITVSNDDATYGDYQADTVSWNATENIIKIQR